MKKIFYRITFLILILAVFMYYIIRNFGAIEKTFSVTLSQSLGYLLLAALFCALAYTFMAIMNKTIFEIMGLKRTVVEMMVLQMSALAVNVVVPSGGLAVTLMFASDAKRRGESEAAAVTAVMLALLADYISIALLLAFAMLYLYFLGSLGLQVIIPAMAFFMLTVGLYLLVYFAGKNKQAVNHFLTKARSLANAMFSALKMKEILKNEGAISKFVDELENAYWALCRDRTDFFKAVGIIFISHFMYLAALYVLFISLGFSPLYRVLISGYAIGMMFVVISPTPNGVGFVEGSMALAYTSLGVSGAAAATVTLVYRGFSFWVPLFIGFVALQRRHLLDLVAERKKNNSLTLG